MAAASTLMLHDLTSGQDDQLQLSGSYRIGSAVCGADGVFFSGMSDDRSISQIYLVKGGSSPQAVSTGPGVKTPLRTDSAGKVLLFSVVGVPSDQGTRAQSSFGVFTAEGKIVSVAGVAPAISGDGTAVVWIERDLDGAEAAEERLMTASTSGAWHPGVVRKGIERLDAPTISPDGRRIAFQMMAREDWEIYIVGRDGTNETRVTREIQHDIRSAVPDGHDASGGHRRTAAPALLPVRSDFPDEDAAFPQQHDQDHCAGIHMGAQPRW